MNFFELMNWWINNEMNRGMNELMNWWIDKLIIAKLKKLMSLWIEELTWLIDDWLIG